MARFTFKSKIPLSAWLWIIASGSLLILWLALMAGIFLSGDTLTEKAIETGQRIEFTPSTMEVKGKQISLADLEPKPKEETPPVTKTPPVETPPVEAPAKEHAPTETPAHDKTPSAGEKPVEPATETHVDPANATPVTPAPVEGVTEAPLPEAGGETSHAEAATGEAAHSEEPHEEAAPAPSGALLPVQKNSPQGILPIISADGKMPWRYFAKGADAKIEGPKIALVISGLGLTKAPTEAALAMPTETTLSFSPYSREAASWLTRAQAAGHETLLDLPMQATSTMDPGPFGLQTRLSAEENYTRLTSSMGRGTGYVGLLTPLDETLTTSELATSLLFENLDKHGLLLVSGAAEPTLPLKQAKARAKVPVLEADVLLDQQMTEDAIKQQLAQAEIAANTEGSALVVGRAFPVTIELAGAWAKTLKEKGITLVPVSTLVPPPPPPPRKAPAPKAGEEAETKEEHH